MATSAGASPPSNGGTSAGTGREPTGCTSDPGRAVSEGPGARRDVALTFDDGPSSTQTPEILETLNRLDAHATFFEEGRHVVGRETLMQEILLDGDEIGNHSFDHPHYPGFGELASTDRRIRRATGFEPCLFRPPYGLVDPKDAAAAIGNRLETILWSFDSGDDHHVPAARMQAHVIGSARPGSIVLMHDGGHHPQTPLALPRVIEGLRERGFRLVTVSELLGGRFLY
ncbi:MAG TPA: polysaccharide deacetylase family protein [Solirubrobacterales bacterium]|jgi:peptidoglycan/xylan/chitin deacetylase (PgdA/CDA1 family)|nr:polysaccharide deacetylase family protein [Solirubrobacterales bacterium]